MTDAPKPFIFLDTVYVPTDNPEGDPMPLLDAWEFQHLGGTLPDARGN